MFISTNAAPNINVAFVKLSHDSTFSYRLWRKIMHAGPGMQLVHISSNILHNSIQDDHLICYVTHNASICWLHVLAKL